MVGKSGSTFKFRQTVPWVCWIGFIVVLTGMWVHCRVTSQQRRQMKSSSTRAAKIDCDFISISEKIWHLQILDWWIIKMNTNADLRSFSSVFSNVFFFLKKKLSFNLRWIFFLPFLLLAVPNVKPPSPPLHTDTVLSAQELIFKSYLKKQDSSELCC